MGIDDLINQGKDLYEQHKDTIGEALKSDQAEGISDTVLDGAADAAKKVAPDQFDGTVDDVRANVDKAVGTE